MFKHRYLKQVIGNIIVLMTTICVFYTDYCSMYNTAFTELHWVSLLILLIEFILVFIQIIRHE